MVQVHRQKRKQSFRDIVVCSLLFCASVKSTVSDAAVMTSGNGSTSDILTIAGDIQADDVGILREILPQNTSLYVVLNSDGGDVYAAMQIGKLVRSNKKMIVVPSNARCLSSCALIYIAGTIRGNAGVVGLHRPYFAGWPKLPQEIEKSLPTMLGDIREYVEAMGVTGEFTNTMLNTPPERMKVFRGAEIEVLVPSRDILFDEKDAASGARTYGVTTQEYRKRQIEVSKKCSLSSQTILGKDKAAMKDATTAYIDCSQAILWGLPVPLYKSRWTTAWEHCQLSDQERAELKDLSPSERNDHSVWRGVETCRLAIMQGRVPN